MKYIEVRNPKWANESLSIIECEVRFETLPEKFVPFAANPNDIYPHTIEIYNRCLSEEFGPIQPFNQE
jgi:hypothetical protein